MPQYFFHLHTEAAIDTDRNGSEFACLTDAIADACAARLEYLRDEAIEDPRLCHRCRFEITDHLGRVVAAVPPADL